VAPETQIRRGPGVAIAGSAARATLVRDRRGRGTEAGFDDAFEGTAGFFGLAVEGLGAVGSAFEGFTSAAFVVADLRGLARDRGSVMARC
jgi:hypothetical protein